MTDADRPRDPGEGPDEGGSPESPRRLDEDAAWREIVAHYGERPEVEGRDRPQDTPAEEDAEPPPPSYSQRAADPMQTEATWDDEGHFIPPDPPLPRLDSRRKWAWTALLVSPVLMLVAALLGWELPRLVSGVLVCGFVGGFGYLVATMENRPHDPPDDGAVV